MAHRRLYISDAKMQILHPNQILRRRRRQLNLDIPSAAIAKGNQLANLANLISGSPVLGGGGFSVLDQDSAYIFLQHVNNQQPFIRFTTETENYSKITFDQPRFARGPCRRPPYNKRLQDTNTHLLPFSGIHTIFKQ